MGEGMPDPAEPSGSLMSPSLLDAAAEQRPYGMSMPAVARMDNLQGLLFPMSRHSLQPGAIQGVVTALSQYSLPRLA